MLESERPEFAMQINALASSFRTEADEAMLEGYWIALSDLTLEAVRMAVARAIRECEHFPRGKELRELGGELGPQGRAVLAWMAASKAVKKIGAYQSVDFDDPVINATIRAMGGWERFIEVSPEDFDKWTRKDFEKIYLSLAQRPIGDEAGAPLIGIIDRTNGFGGYEIKEPLRITTGLPPLQITGARKQSAIESQGQPIPRLVLKKP